MKLKSLAITLTLAMSSTAAVPPPAPASTACSPPDRPPASTTGAIEGASFARPGTYVGSFRSSYSVPRAYGTAVSTGEIRLTVASNGSVEGTVTINTTATIPYGGGGGSATAQLSGNARHNAVIKTSSGHTGLRVDTERCSLMSGAVVPGPAWAAMQSGGATPITGSWSVRRVSEDEGSDPEERELNRLKEKAGEEATRLLDEARAVTNPMAPGVFPTPAQSQAHRAAIRRGEKPAPLNDLMNRLGRAAKELALVEDECLAEEMVEAMRDLAKRRLDERLKEISRTENTAYTRDQLLNLAHEIGIAEALGVEPPACLDEGYATWDQVAQDRFENGIKRARSFKEAQDLYNDAAVTEGSGEAERNWATFEEAVKPKVEAAAQGDADAMEYMEGGDQAASQAGQAGQNPGQNPGRGAEGAARTSAARGEGNANAMEYGEGAARAANQAGQTVAQGLEDAARTNIAEAEARLAEARAEAAAVPADEEERARAAARNIAEAERGLVDARKGSRLATAEAAKLRTMFGW